MLLNRPWRRLAVVLLYVFVLLTSNAIAADASASGMAPADEGRVKLGVIIVVDQLRGDLLERFAPHFGPDGFKRLIREGANFPNAYFSYGPCSTAVGHATIATGRLPGQHGVINNEGFFDPDVNKPQHIVLDPDEKAVGLAETDKAAGYSPWALIGPTLGDELKLADRRSRVFSVSMKHRAAIMIAGRSADGVYWFDRTSGKMMTSTWYELPFPSYLAEFNSGPWTDRFIGQTWDKLLGDEAYASCHPLPAEYMRYDCGLGTSFPHRLTKPADMGKPYDCVYASPQGNEMTLEVARRILVNEKLGQGPATDLLCISFSANDVAGHIFGPSSAEYLDMTVRTDRLVAELLDLLDKQVGLRHCAIVLTGDHGVKEIPQLTKAARLGGDHLDLEPIVDELNALLADRFGPLGGEKPYVLGILPPWLWFDHGFEDWDVDKQMLVMYAAAEHLAQVEGIEAVFTADELELGPPLSDDLPAWLAWRSYCPGRSGQLYVHLEAFWYEKEDDAITGHGSGHSADRHVPILLFGPGVKPGRYLHNVDPVDIAPTLAAMLRIKPPLDAVGRVLAEAFEP